MTSTKIEKKIQHTKNDQQNYIQYQGHQGDTYANCNDTSSYSSWNEQKIAKASEDMEKKLYTLLVGM